jgi:hypothetical protein
MFCFHALACSITASLGVDCTSATDIWCRTCYFYTKKGLVCDPMSCEATVHI